LDRTGFDELAGVEEDGFREGIPGPVFVFRATDVDVRGREPARLSEKERVAKEERRKRSATAVEEDWQGRRRKNKWERTCRRAPRCHAADERSGSGLRLRGGKVEGKVSRTGATRGVRRALREQRQLGSVKRESHFRTAGRKSVSVPSSGSSNSPKNLPLAPLQQQQRPPVAL
jgi:hypothetical protein